MKLGDSLLGKLFELPADRCGSTVGTPEEREEPSTVSGGDHVQVAQVINEGAQVALVLRQVQKHDCWIITATLGDIDVELVQASLQLHLLLPVLHEGGGNTRLLLEELVVFGLE